MRGVNVLVRMRVCERRVQKHWLSLRQCQTPHAFVFSPFIRGDTDGDGTLLMVVAESTTTPTQNLSYL